MTPTWKDGTEPLVGGGLVQAGKVDRQVRAALAAAKEVQPTGDHKSFLFFMGLPESFFDKRSKEPQRVPLTFERWWEEHGQYCRSGGGQYEKSFAYAAWGYLLKHGIKEGS